MGDIPVDLLDKAVEQKRRELFGEADKLGGDAVRLSQPEPWADPVDGSTLLTELVQSVRRHVVMRDPGHDALAIALWVVLTYLHEAIETSPLLAVLSPEARCGKTTLLGWLARVCNRVLATSNLSEAALYRVIAEHSPTLLIDEADAFLQMREEMRGLLDSGHTRDTAFVLRCVGEAQEVRQFSTWCPKSIALIGRLPHTLHDRSIPIQLQRRLPGDKRARLPGRHNSELVRLRRQIARFAQDISPLFAQDEPPLLDGLNDRAQDNWAGMLTVAFAAGGEWPQKAKRAALALSGTEEEAGTGTRLLQDIREIFAKKQSVSEIATRTLLEELIELEERPWATYHRGRALSAHQLAEKLRGFGISSQKLGPEAARFRGYRKGDFTEAFGRYLQAQTPPA
jgi:hypothetical protein